jgi:hypothetical protein
MLRRVVLPLGFVATILVAAALLQQASLREENSPQMVALPVATRVAQPAPQPGLGQEDPRLDMNAVEGRAPLDDVSPPTMTVTMVTRWVSNSATTNLWSGPNAQASAFTELPSASYLRVTGPEDGSRIPVYYVGDGLFRRPGNGWVDSAAVDTIDAPPPGQVSAVDADAQQPVPLWVQAHKATTLWSGPDDEAVTLTDLPQWTFLKIAGLERGGRLLVNYAGDYASRQPGIGWVDRGTVGPSGDPGRWITNHRATALWSGVDDNALRFTEVPQWTRFRLVEGAAADANRLQVEFFGDGLTRLPGLAWLARADIGPITPPVPLPAPVIAQVSAVQQIERRTFASGAEFINEVGAAAQRSRQATGVPASVTVAQAILESDWGRSRLSRQANNLFGIKALGSVTGPAGVVSIATWEHVNGVDVIVQAPFKAYFTIQQSIDDHGTFFTRNRRYKDALAVGNDAQAFARAIQDAGYATDPSYAAKLIRLMDRYDLYRFD